MNETSDRCGTWGPGRSPRAAARVVVFADRSPSREPGGPNESPGSYDSSSAIPA